MDDSFMPDDVPPEMEVCGERRGHDLRPGFSFAAYVRCMTWSID